MCVLIKSTPILSIPILCVLLSVGNACLPRQKPSNFPLKIRNIKIETHQKRLLEDEEWETKPQLTPYTCQTPKPLTHTYDTIGTHYHPNPNSHVWRSEDEASFSNPYHHLTAMVETFFWGIVTKEVRQKKAVEELAQYKVLWRYKMKRIWIGPDQIGTKLHYSF